MFRMKGSKKPVKSASKKLGIYIAPDARIKRRMNVKWPPCFRVVEQFQ